MKKIRIAGTLAVTGLVALTACSSSKSSTSTTAKAAASTTAAAAATTASATAGKNITIYVITHGDNGVFWSVAQKGAEAAGKDLGITVKYEGANNNGVAQAGMERL